MLKLFHGKFSLGISSLQWCVIHLKIFLSFSIHLSFHSHLWYVHFNPKSTYESYFFLDELFVTISVLKYAIKIKVNSNWNSPLCVLCCSLHLLWMWNLVSRSEVLLFWCEVVCQAQGVGGKEDVWKWTSNQINLTGTLRLFKVNLMWKRIKISAIATMLYRKLERAVRKKSGGLWVIKGSPCKL